MGRVVNCGNTENVAWDMNLDPLRSKRLSLSLSLMGSNGYLNETLKSVKTGHLKAVVHRVFPFEQVQDAHKAMINRDNFGKIVLTW